MSSTRRAQLDAMAEQHQQSIPILELSLPTPPPAGAAWTDAYRHWLG